MSTVLSALVVLAALTASGVLLVQLFVSESRRSKGTDARQAIPLRVAPKGHPDLPERAVPPPPAPRARRAPAPPAAAVPSAQPVAASVLSADGAWLWTGSEWVPAWWGGPTVPPPPAYATSAYPLAAAPRRSSGCLAALGTCCAVVLVLATVIALAAIAAAGGLTSLIGLAGR